MSELQQPLLSICIPTFNRSEYLKKSIESIVCQKEFINGKVEIVISDNASTDNTENVIREFQQKYPNIYYSKNKENIRDRNYPLVLGKSHGILRKLCNDTLIFNKDSLQHMIQIVMDNIDEKPVLFFDNKNTESVSLDGLEAFLEKVSFNITWIGAFSVWNDFCDDIKDNTEGCDESLWQVPFLCKYINTKKRVLVIEEPFSTIQQVEKKNISYGLYKVFYKNYLGYVKNYVRSGIVSQNCFDWLEKDLLFNFFPYWMVQFTLQNKHLDYSKSEDLVQCVKTSYKSKSYYTQFIRFYRFYFLKIIVKKIIHRV